MARAERRSRRSRSETAPPARTDYNRLVNTLTPMQGYSDDQIQQIHDTALQVLEELGLEVRQGVGVIGLLQNGNGSGVVGLRAELDALPITERGGRDYASQLHGIMHACGHDGHMAMLVTAAQDLAQTRDFDGTVVFLFQPAEEHGQGALAMLEENVLEETGVQELYAIHTLPGLEVGHVRTRSGLICASESLFEIDIVGQGGHAAMPQTGRDALTVAAALIGDLHTVVPRQLGPASSAVLSVTECLTDGQRNVLPGHVTLRGDVRAGSSEERTRLAAAMRQMIDGICAAYGVSGSMSFRTEFIETKNDPAAVAAVAAAAEARGISCNAEAEPMSFSEDFAHFAERVPACFMLLGNGETSAPLHAPGFDFNDEALPVGGQLLAELVRQRLPVLR